MKCVSWKRHLAAALAALGMLTPSALWAADLNVNLAVNGGFESVDVNDPGPFTSVRILDWTDPIDDDDNFAYPYSSLYSGFPEPPGGGAYHFTGGFNTTIGDVLMTQSFSVGTGPSGALIQTGAAVYDLRAYFSSYQEQLDASIVRAVFKNGSGTALGQAEIGGLGFLQSIPVTFGQRDWGQAIGVGPIPINTATVELQVVAADADANHDGYVDLIDFQVTDRPILPALDISVDRTTGSIRLRNQTAGPVNLAGYSILSDAGALDPATWLSIADNYDANSGGSVDPINIWTETSATDFDLTEVSAGGGATLAVGRSVTLGNTWRRNPIEDLSFQYTSAGSTVTGLVAFAGNNGNSFGVGDFNADGMLSAGDWQILRAYQLADLSSLSPVGAYLRGDLNGDLRNNHADFVIFRDRYDQINGAGAFDDMLASIPEPGTSWLVTMAGLTLLGATRRRAA